MNGNECSMARDFDQDTASDLSEDGWLEKFAKTAVRRGRPPAAKPKISTTIRLSQDAIDHLKAGSRGWQRGSTKHSESGSGRTALRDRRAGEKNRDVFLRHLSRTDVFWGRARAHQGVRVYGYATYALEQVIAELRKGRLISSGRVSSD